MKHSTHTQIYYQLVVRLQKTKTDWESIGFLSIGLIAVIIVILTGYIEDVLSTIELIWVSIALLLFFSTILILLHFSVALFNAGRPAQNNVHYVTALLLLKLKRQSKGFLQDLSVDDIQQISNIATIEQSAADWRGATIGLALALLASSIWLLETFGESFTLNISGASTGEFTIVLNLISVCGLFIILLFGAGLAYRMINAYTTFLRDETANRTILFSCEEALNLLSEHSDDGPNLSNYSKCF